MTPNEWIEKQRKKIAQIETGEPLLKAALETHRTMANRIFIIGRKSNGSDTGKYNSTKGFYLNPRKSPKSFPTGGKRGNKKKNGQSYKTGYFKSYKDYRAAIGRPTDKVDLNLSGQLQSDFVAGIRKVNNSEVIVALKNPVNQKKRRGNEKRFGIIFNLTKEERKIFNEQLTKEVNKVLNA